MTRQKLPSVIVVVAITSMTRFTSAECDPIGWRTFGTGVTATSGSAEVDCMAVWDDGTGEALYVGGTFTHVDGVAASNLAKWDGTTWTPLSTATNGAVHSLHVWDDGTGEALYVGGRFTQIGAVEANRIAKWTGQAFEALGSGVFGSQPRVHAMVHFDDGTGEALYVGGLFSQAGGVNRSNIARWTGTTWQSVGSGTNGLVWALTVHDDSTGAALYAGGIFTMAGGSPVSYIARWNSSGWSPVGSGLNWAVNALATFDDGGGRALYAGGAFNWSGNQSVGNLAKWNGIQWSGGYTSNSTDGIYVLHPYQADGKQLLFAGGRFGAPSVALNGLGAWNGTTWHTFSSGINIEAWEGVSAIQVFETSVGPMLVVGGNFAHAGLNPASRIAYWSPIPPWLDCNGNRTLDLCESASPAAFDCNMNSAPDECEANFAYVLGQNSYGWSYLTQPADVLWLNQFRVNPGSEVITHVGIQWSFRARDGLPVFVHLYSDPNNDGNPSDAVLLSSGLSENLGTSEFYSDLPYARVPIAPTYVGPSGTSFFVGASAQCDANSLYLIWADLDPVNAHRSWHVVTPPGQLNPAQIGSHTLINQSNTVYTLRAMALDCNGNDVWDQCDIDDGVSIDINRDGIPDECQVTCAADVSPPGDGTVDINDLLFVIANWGTANGPPDINDDGGVNILDLLAIIAVWGPCN